jgi:hypothetical protein
MDRSSGSTGEADRLNKGCLCVTLDRDALATAFDRETSTGFTQGLERSHPLLFANVSVFVPEPVLADMMQVVAAVEASARLPGYREAVLGRTAPLARRDHGPAGVLMGYDFHLAADGPKLIEINTNAGGAFLTAPLARAQRACCAPAKPMVSSAQGFADNIVGMFEAEWDRQRGAGRPRRIAILDDDPETQYLLPEFLLVQALLRAHGIDAIIGDPRDLKVEGNAVLLRGVPVDLVYNRLVDFALEDPSHVVLRDAYEAGQLVVTPNPHVYALFADKRNLALLCDNGQMRAWGLEPPHLAALQATALQTLLVTASNAERLWADRKAWFFKPARGHASKAAYRGDKLTRRVWGDILAGDYVAQAYAAPGLRDVQHAGERAELKADVRLYTYDGRVLLSAARLYRGQTTNMRTPGGGFAPVLIVPEGSDRSVASGGATIAGTALGVGR